MQLQCRRIQDAFCNLQRTSVKPHTDGRTAMRFPHTQLKASRPAKCKPHPSTRYQQTCRQCQPIAVRFDSNPELGSPADTHMPSHKRNDPDQERTTTRHQPRELWPSMLKHIMPEPLKRPRLSKSWPDNHYKQKSCTASVKGSGTMSVIPGTNQSHTLQASCTDKAISICLL